MTDFSYNALQYVDFATDNDDVHNDSYFDVKIEENVAVNPSHDLHVYEVISDTESENLEQSNMETERFYSVVNVSSDSPVINITNKMRRSLSMTNLPQNQSLSGDSNQQCQNNHFPKSTDTDTSNHKVMKAHSQDFINRLAQPKRFTSQTNLTLAEAVVKFQVGTPKRFRSNPPKIKKAIPIQTGKTMPQTPKFQTVARVRPVTAMSREEQEEKEIEEARKFKIKANPVNKNVLKEPKKASNDKKPPTIMRPFNLTQSKRKTMVEEHKPLVFKAQPIPKSLHNGFKVQHSSQPPTEAQSPNFSKRLTKFSEKKCEQPKKIEPTTNPLKATQPVPFSFHKRDQEILKKKEDFLNKVLQEEKQAREFHARPVPRKLLSTQSHSQDPLNQTGVIKKLSKLNTADLHLQPRIFKARSASVLHKEPFEPKKGEDHIVLVQEFHLSTEQRLQNRRAFEEKLKEKEVLAAAQKKMREDLLKKQEEQERANIRKQMKHKAQPIKKYKEVLIQSSNKVTEPVSPKFRCDRIRNKENINIAQQ